MNLIRKIILAVTLSTSFAHAADKHIVVYGGTPGGIAAAVAAAREGASVTLIEPTSHIGGLTTSGLTTAETEHMLAWTIGGIADEFFHRMGKHYGRKGDRRAYNFESGVAEKIFHEMLKEVGVQIRYGAHVHAVAMDGNRIKEIKLSNESGIAGDVFIDASYEGDLMAIAGVSSTFGRESRDTYDEPLAGIRFDKTPRVAKTVDASGKLLAGITDWKKNLKEGDAHPGVMNFNFRMIVTRDPKHRVPFPKPENYDRSRYQLLANWLEKEQERKSETPLSVRQLIGFYPRPNQKFAINNKQSAIISLGHFGGQFDWVEATPEKRKAIYQDHLDYTLGLLHFLATDIIVPASIHAEMKELGLHNQEFVDNNHLPYQLYVREGRRLIGEYVMRQQDVQTDVKKDDSIGMGSHFMDCHHVQRLAVNENEFINEGRIWRMGYAYQIPYRAITPKAEESSNLLVPVASSFSHVAYCTFRVEATWMVAGESAGVAAVMAAKNGVKVQEVEIADLQKKLREKKQVIDFIPDMPTKCEHLNGPPEF